MELSILIEIIQNAFLAGTSLTFAFVIGWCFGTVVTTVLAFALIRRLR